MQYQQFSITKFFCRKEEWAEYHCENVYLLKNLDKLDTFQGTPREWETKHTFNILKLKKRLKRLLFLSLKQALINVLIHPQNKTFVQNSQVTQLYAASCNIPYVFDPFND